MEQRRCSANRYPIPQSAAQKLPHFLRPAGSFLISWSGGAKLRQRQREEGQKTHKRRLKDTKVFLFCILRALRLNISPTLALF